MVTSSMPGDDNFFYAIVVVVDVNLNISKGTVTKLRHKFFWVIEEVVSDVSD